MPYADITFKDKNPIKRWLQRKRLISAINLCAHTSQTYNIICDFGAGNGELCKHISVRYPNSQIICYDPTPRLLLEAKENLQSIPNMVFFSDALNIQPATVDILFCLEVFEHLPPEETEATLDTISQIMKPEGVIVIGTPVEVGLAALYKGVIRMLRRYGSFDASLNNIIRALFYRPPTNRPISEIAPGVKYYCEHMGFDFRRFKSILKRYFIVTRTATSPFSLPGTLIMPELYFVAQKKRMR